MTEDVHPLQDRFDDLEKEFYKTWYFHMEIMANLRVHIQRENRPYWNPIRIWRKRKALRRLKIRYATELAMMLRFSEVWSSFYLSAEHPIRDNDAVGFLQCYRWYEYHKSGIEQEYTAALKEIGK